MKIELEYQTGYQVALRLWALVEAIDPDARFAWLEPTCQDMDTQLAEKITKMQTILAEQVQAVQAVIANHRVVFFSEAIEKTIADPNSLIQLVPPETFPAGTVISVTPLGFNSDLSMGVPSYVETPIPRITLNIFNNTGAPIDIDYTFYFAAFVPVATIQTDAAPASAGECEDFKILTP